MNKQQFLDGITGKPVDFEVDGLQIKIRSLTVMETKDIQANYTGKEFEAALVTVIYGVVEPKLDMDDLEAIQGAKPGAVIKISKAIADSSGLTVENDDSPN